jgi:hypothetical protein
MAAQPLFLEGELKAAAIAVKAACLNQAAALRRALTPQGAMRMEPFVAHPRLKAGPRARAESGPPAARITTYPRRLHALRTRVHAAQTAILSAVHKYAAKEAGASNLTPRFLMSEWTHVVDAWQLGGAEDYATVPRLGRSSRIGAKQRDRLWPVFEGARRVLARRGLMTWPQVFAALSRDFANGRAKPFAHIAIDEAQDLGIPELRFLAAIAPDSANALFFDAIYVFKRGLVNPTSDRGIRENDIGAAIGSYYFSLLNFIQSEGPRRSPTPYNGSLLFALGRQAGVAQRA